MVEEIQNRVISIDDSGWRFPIGGTLVGLRDSLTERIVFDEVPVKYYQRHFRADSSLY